VRVEVEVELSVLPLQVPRDCEKVLLGSVGVVMHEEASTVIVSVNIVFSLVSD